ncbi:MAG: glycosyltransferase family 4 protein [archaeon]
MKILLTTSFYPPYHIGGDAVHVKYLAEGLAKRGHNVHVMFSVDAYKFKKKGNFNGIENLNNVTFHPLSSPLGKFEPILNYSLTTMPYTFGYFERLIKNNNFDVVHHHNISLLGEGILKKLGGYVNLYTAHDYWLVCPKFSRFSQGRVCDAKKGCFSCCLRDRKPYPVARIFQGFKKHASDIDAIICPSDFMANAISKEFKKCRIIYNFITTENKTIENEINAKYKKGNYFLFAGILENEKGIMELISIFKKNKKNLIIAGDGPLKAEVQRESLDNINYVGWLKPNELHSFIRGCNAVIIPSVCEENFPTIALEALSYGKPVIGSDKGGIPEIVGKIGSKLIFHSFDELEELLESTNLKIYNEKKIEKIYEDYFSEDKYFKSYFSLIDNICKK